MTTKVGTKKINKLKVKKDDLRFRCKPENLSFKSTSELPGWEGTLDQKEAIDAIKFGLSIKNRGFNIFAVGMAGSGKTSTIQRLVKERASQEPVSKDVCYLYNFDDPLEPVALFLPPGKGKNLEKLIKNLVKKLNRETQRILTTPAINRIRSEMSNKTRESMNDSLQYLMEEAKKRGIHIKVSEDGELVPAAMYKDKLITEDALSEFPEMSSDLIEIQKKLAKANLELVELSVDFEKKHRKMEKEMQETIEKEEKKLITPLIEEYIEEINEKFKFSNEVLDNYLKHLKNHYLDNYESFSDNDHNNDDSGLPQEAAEILMGAPVSDKDEIPIEFMVNVLVDRSKETCAPVYMEKMPNLSSLIGYLEYNDRHGILSTNHTLIRPGALHRANGGYLIIQANDVLTNPQSWLALKKALRHKEIRIEGLYDSSKIKIKGTVKPSPLSLNVKVILVGNSELYYLLHNHDEEFNRLFKVKSDFSNHMKRNPQNIESLARFLGQIAREENYLPLSAAAVSNIVEYASRLTNDRGLMNNRTSILLNLLSESDFWAKERGEKKFIESEDIDKALVEKNKRHSRIEKLATREIKINHIVIKTTGEAVGQINGMAVYDLGDHAFGIPARISAITFAGKKGVVNIDREVNLSGNIHDKGSMIMVGYLANRFAQNYPMHFNASITFEQSYSTIDGDSASSTELLALLSSLSKIPVKQDFAVTGSVNQHGEIQAIGGVNEKIEGFFKICKMTELTGNQGVIIPKSNIRNLMLKKEVVNAVEDGKFHVYAVSHIDEAIEILTGVKAGKRLKNGSWEKDSINYLVDKKIHEYSEKVRKLS
ncbi:MAG: AAA family ATPase [Myxococcota bacterium]